MPVIGGNAIQHGVAYDGMVADGELYNGVSKLNKGTVPIPYGAGVVTDGDDGAKLPAAGDTAAKFVGIVKYELNRAQSYLGTDVFGAPPKRDMTLMTVGVLWVTPNVAVTKDQQVYLIIGDGTGTLQGKFSNVAGTAGTTAVLVPNAKWVSSASAGQRAKISLNIGG